MKIYVASASLAVTRTLESIVQSAGHTTGDAKSAEFAIADMRHPLPNLPKIPTLQLVAGEATDAMELSCPIRPAQLLQPLKLCSAPAHVPLPGGWTMDTIARTLMHPDYPSASLTEKECALLKVLAEAAPNAVERDALLTQVWGIGGDVDTHTLETHIYRLRSKLSSLAEVPAELITVAGAYKLVPR